MYTYIYIYTYINTCSQNMLSREGSSSLRYNNEKNTPIRPIIIVIIRPNSSSHSRIFPTSGVLGITWTEETLLHREVCFDWNTSRYGGWLMMAHSWHAETIRSKTVPWGKLWKKWNHRFLLLCVCVCTCTQLHSYSCYYCCSFFVSCWGVHAFGGYLTNLGINPSQCHCWVVQRVDCAPCIASKLVSE